MANECMPKYEPGQDLTGFVTTVGGVLGCRVLALTGNKRGNEAVSDDTTGGNIQVGYPAAGARHVGVAGHDMAQNGLVKVVRGKGKVVPIMAGAAITFDQEVEATATGAVIPKASGAAIGRAFRSASNATLALIELY